MSIFKHGTISQYIKYYGRRETTRGEKRAVRKDKLVRPRGHRTTDAIKRAGAKRSHTDEQKRDGCSKGNTRNRVLGEEYRHKHVRAGTVILFEGRGVPTRRTRGNAGNQRGRWEGKRFSD